LLRVMAFGVALFTLIVQGTTMRPLVRWLRLAVRSEAREEYQTRHASLAAWRAAESHLDRMHDQGLVSTPTWEKLKPEIVRRVGSSTDAMREVVLVKPELEAAELDTASRELLRARRGALQDLRRDGIISEEVFGKLAAEVDTMLTEDAGLVVADEEVSPQFVEVRLEEGSRAAGKSIMDLSLPHEIVIVSVRRGRELILPRGDTLLQPGDMVTAVCKSGLAETVKAALSSPGEKE
jgi:NhaP-type Na+/H+ and K+/H+ antiporter